jgi:hypothetical protein
MLLTKMLVKRITYGQEKESMRQWAGQRNPRYLMTPRRLVNDDLLFVSSLVFSGFMHV